ncbi:transcriptional regulator [Pseudomonas syringae pv. cerasicola]|nr:AbrB/MazE/SpoVT family DNA-binding domain-containing protein [Pseudomonas syringae]PHN80648.1 transcriptional regulator [Pseudomonas syringae pv. cerasicola]
MTTLTVTARGQVTFRKDVLQHLGIRLGDKIELDLLPDGRGVLKADLGIRLGDKIELDLLPDGRGVLKAARPAGTIASFVGLLAGKTQKVATIEEINEAAAQGWAGKQ